MSYKRLLCHTKKASLSYEKGFYNALNYGEDTGESMGKVGEVLAKATFFCGYASKGVSLCP